MALILVASDIHFPYHCTKTLKKFFRYLEVRPTDIVLLGDIVDFYPISKFIKIPDRLLSLKKELKEAVSFLKRLRELSPESNIYYIEGNHEERLQKFLFTYAPQLTCIMPTIAQLLELPQLNIKYVQKKQGIKLYGIRFFHGDITRKNPGAALLEVINRNPNEHVVIGHTHHLTHVCITKNCRTTHGIEAGCMADPKKQVYLSYPYWGWSRGFVLIEKTTDIKVNIIQ